MSKKTLLVSAIIMIIVVASATVNFISSLHKDTDKDGILDWDETHKYYTDPNKPNPILAYLIKQNKVSEYKLFRPLDSDGLMQANEKALIDYYNLLAKDYRDNPKILELLKNIVSDGEVTQKELKTFKDPDSDGLDTLYEILIGTNPFKPNPNVAYLVKNGITQHLDLVKPLDSEGLMQAEEKS